MERYYIKVYGRVQGVGFRYTAMYLAKSCNITGWVKNCDDGSVHMEVQGSSQAVNKFIIKIKSSSGFIRVDDIDMQKINSVDNERSFDVKY